MANPAVIPISVHKSPPIRTKRGRMTILTPQETLALLKAARKRSTRDWAMILLAYRHGLRASEVCGIKLADVDLKSGSISIRRLKGSLHTIQPIYQHRGQPLLDETAALRAWLRKRAAEGSDYLFTSQKGGKLSRTQFFRNFQMVAEKAGLPVEKRHPHVLKHSLASHPGGGDVNLAWYARPLGIVPSIPPCSMWVPRTPRQLKPYRRLLWGMLYGLVYKTENQFCCVLAPKAGRFKGLRDGQL